MIYPISQTTPILQTVDVLMERERIGRIDWLNDLRDAITTGDLDSAVQAIDAAVKMLEKQR